jgi:excisionase family DNA binding protein
MTRYLTIQEVAQLARCEHRTVRRAIRSGELNASLIGGRWIVREDAVEAWFGARANHRILSASGVDMPTTRRNRPARPAARSGPSRPGSVADLEAIRERILEP